MFAGKTPSKKRRLSYVEVSPPPTPTECQACVEEKVELKSSDPVVEELRHGKRTRKRPSYLKDYVVTYHA